MVILGYKLYIYMLMFALCAVLGNIGEQLMYMIDGGRGRRGFMKWPVSTMYGIDGVLTLAAAHFTDSAAARITAVFALFIAADLAALAIVKAISGVRMWRIDKSALVIGAAAFSLLCVLDLRMLILLFESMPVWLELILLLAFYTVYISQLVDSLDMMHRLKVIVNNKMTLDEHQRLVLAEPYTAWIKAYPEVKRALFESLGTAVRQR
ncbi:MAG: hypothetical protein ACI4LM_00305 [Anaerovoracaceae bacterium]